MKRRILGEFSRMYQSILGIAMLFFLSFFISGCVRCNDIGCPYGGFGVTATMAGGNAYSKGEYTVHLVVEEHEFDIYCQVTNTYETSQCDDGQIASPSGWKYTLKLLTGLTDGDIEHPDPAKPVIGIRFFAAHETNSGRRGPTSLDVQIQLADIILIENSYSPQYERDNDYYGDEDCGYCETTIEEELIIN